MRRGQGCRLRRGLSEAPGCGGAWCDGRRAGPSAGGVLVFSARAQELVLSKTFLHTAGCFALGEALGRMRRLKKLNLWCVEAGAVSGRGRAGREACVVCEACPGEAGVREEWGRGAVLHRARGARD